jgi:hypothetical protein
MNPEKATRDRRVIWKDGRRCAGSFFLISEAEVKRAIGAKLPPSAWMLWNYIGIRVSGNPDGWRIGIKELHEATGLSAPSIWRAAAALDRAGLVHKRRKPAGNVWTLCDGGCEECLAALITASIECG